MKTDAARQLGKTKEQVERELNEESTMLDRYLYLQSLIEISVEDKVHEYNSSQFSFVNGLITAILIMEGRDNSYIEENLLSEPQIWDEDKEKEFEPERKERFNFFRDENLTIVVKGSIISLRQEIASLLNSCNAIDYNEENIIYQDPRDWALFKTNLEQARFCLGSAFGIINNESNPYEVARINRKHNDKDKIAPKEHNSDKIIRLPMDDIEFCDMLREYMDDFRNRAFITMENLPKININTGIEFWAIEYVRQSIISLSFSRNYLGQMLGYIRDNREKEEVV